MLMPTGRAPRPRRSFLGEAALRKKTPDDARWTMAASDEPRRTAEPLNVLRETYTSSDRAHDIADNIAFTSRTSWQARREAGVTGLAQVEGAGSLL